MRLLAHGGTSYSERHRIGVWNAIPREVLESTYGLPGDSITYGLGILDDCLPFLILRVRQTTDIGRTYAYSVLLDPGREIWEKFGWNAADLLRAILADPVGETLLSEPETLTAEDLIRKLSQFSPLQTNLVPSRHFSQMTDDLAYWMGAIFSDEPAVIKPSALGFTGRPNLDHMAGVLNRIPQPCFRAGAGWLVGGSREHGESLGARLVLDDGMDLATPTEPYLERGRQATGAWATISNQPHLRTILSALEEIPICGWKDTAGAPASALLARLDLLRQMLQSAQLPDQLFGTIEHQLKGFPFLATEIRRAAHRRLLKSKQSLSAAQTTLVLRNFYEHDLELGKTDLLLLDREILTRIVVENESQNAGLRTSLTLPPEVSAEIYVRMIGSAPQYRDVPRLLGEAAEFIARSFGAGALGKQWLERVFAAVEQRTKTTADSLHVWDTFPHNHLWISVSDMLQEAARNRAKFRSAEWELEYLTFGKDPGGEQLCHDGIDSATATRLVNRYLNEMRDQTDLAPMATDWLDRLALSQLRLRISIADKLAVARTGSSKRWLPLLALWAAYVDDPEVDDTGSMFSRRNPSQREFQREELLQMLEQFPPRSSFPDMARLQKLLGVVPDDFLAELRKPQRQLPPTRAFARWIQGLLTINEVELASKEVARFCLESRDPLPRDWFFRKFDEQTMMTLADRLLFRGIASEDPFCRGRCEEVLTSQHHLSRLRKIFYHSFKTGHADRVSLENFIRRYRGHEPALNGLFACFSRKLRQYIVTKLDSHDPNAFMKETRDIINEVESGVPLNDYRYAVLWYVRWVDPELIRKLVRWTLLTRSGLEILLDKVLDGYNERGDKDLTDDLDGGEVVSGDLEPTPAPDDALMAAVPSAKIPVPPDGPEHREASPSSGIGGKMRSFLRSLVYEEPPPSLPGEEATSSAPSVKKDDSK